MIDLEKELQLLAKNFGLSEKEVLTWFRSAIRQMWGNSPMKRTYMQKHVKLVTNTNPRSMKKYPRVKKYECNIDGKLYPQNKVELDHLESENSLKSYSDADGFMKAILFTSPNKLQILSKDNHKIKTYAERYNMTFEQATKAKEFIQLKKDKKVVDKLIELGVISKDIPKTKKGQEEMLYKLLLGEQHGN